MSTKGVNARGSMAPSLIAITTLLTLCLTGAEGAAQQPDMHPSSWLGWQRKRGANACKVEICTAFAKPTTGAPIACDVTKTWTQQDIVARIMGGSYVWGYGHVQCNVKLSLDRSLIVKAMTGGKGVYYSSGARVCLQRRREGIPPRARPFIKVMVTPAVTFEGAKPKTAALESKKQRGRLLRRQQ